MVLIAERLVTIIKALCEWIVSIFLIWFESFVKRWKWNKRWISYYSLLQILFRLKKRLNWIGEHQCEKKIRLTRLWEWSATFGVDNNHNAWLAKTLNINRSFWYWRQKLQDRRSWEKNLIYRQVTIAELQSKFQGWISSTGLAYNSFWHICC